MSEKIVLSPLATRAISKALKELRDTHQSPYGLDSDNEEFIDEALQILKMDSVEIHGIDPPDLPSKGDIYQSRKDGFLNKVRIWDMMEDQLQFCVICDDYATLYVCEVERFLLDYEKARDDDD